MWLHVLSAGVSESKTDAILDRLHWMDASVWYDSQIEKLQEHPPRTKRGRPARRVATFVLNDLHAVAEARIPDIRGKADDKIRKDLVRLFSKGDNSDL